MAASRGVVGKNIRECWPDNAGDVMATLDQYGASSATEEGRARVQLAVLKLADGSREALQEYIDRARQDYRDVLASAEYPRGLKARHLVRADLLPRQQRELELIRRQDREQHLTWSKNA